MAFFVVRLAPDLSEQRRAAVVAEDPAFLDAPRPYVELMGEAGFTEVTEADVTAAYLATCGRWLSESAAMEAELREALGDAVYDDKQTRRGRNAALADAGLVGRSLLTGVG